MSGNFTIGLTPKTFESGDLNQIKSVETTNFDIFVAPTADAPNVTGLYAGTPDNAVMAQLLQRFLEIFHQLIEMVQKKFI